MRCTTHRATKLATIQAIGIRMRLSHTQVNPTEVYRIKLIADSHLAETQKQGLIIHRLFLAKSTVYRIKLIADSQLAETQ